MSTPTASYPDSSACTSVVPEPANGSSTRPPEPHVPHEQRLDELRDELPEVRVKAVDVLRPLPLRQLRLRPRKLEVVGELAVERVLGRSHAPWFDREPGPERSLSGWAGSDGLSQQRNALDAATLDADSFELDVEPRELGMRSEPGSRCHADTRRVFSASIISRG